MSLVNMDPLLMVLTMGKDPIVLPVHGMYQLRGVKGLLIKSADDTRFGGVANIQEERIQSDLDRLGTWADVNKM